MKEQLKVSLLQAQLTWHQPDNNFDEVRRLLDHVHDTDLILLPEMWPSGFTMKVHQNHQCAPKALALMHEWARAKAAVVGGSMIVKVDDQYYNRFYLVDGDKVLATYDKKHLFAFAGEDRSFTAGNERCVVELHGWRLRLNVCYDLRFPVWARNEGDYDVLIYVANWPDQRIAAWDSLLIARAIENQSYVLGANCFGTDAWKNSYQGHSAIIEPSGAVQQNLVNQSGILEATLDKELLHNFRNKFPFWKDRDPFKLV